MISKISGAAVRWLVVSLIVAVTSNSDVDPTPAGDEDWGCTAAAAEYQSLGDVNSVPMTRVEGGHLRVCEYRQMTCCSSDMESIMKAHSRRELVRAVADRIVLAKQTYLSRAAKFDAFFVDLFNNSRRNLETFGRSFGFDSQMFVSLFRDLKSYYKGTDLSLADLLDRFFTRLAVRLLRRYGSSAVSTASSVGCVAEQVDRLQAFGDAPRRLSSQIRKSFTVARNFVHGLAVGRDTIATLDNLLPSTACVDDITRLLYCSMCRGRATSSSTPRCRGHCSNIVRACLSVHIDVNTAWNDYLHQLLQLSEKLNGPHNIEHVADTLHQRLSDAVTSFQHNIDHLVTAVQSCVDSASGGTDGQQVRWEAAVGRQQTRWSTDGNVSPLTRLVRETRGRLYATRDLWRLLPEQVCDELTVTAFDNNSLCWNGRSYSHDVYYDATSANPPLPFAFHHASRSDYLVFELRTAANKLKNAYHGVDVSWIDSSDDVSGSGSGADETISLRGRSSRLADIPYIQRLLMIYIISVAHRLTTACNHAVYVLLIIN